MGGMFLKDERAFENNEFLLRAIFPPEEGERLVWTLGFVFLAHVLLSLCLGSVISEHRYEPNRFTG